MTFVKLPIYALGKVNLHPPNNLSNLPDMGPSSFNPMPKFQISEHDMIKVAQT